MLSVLLSPLWLMLRMAPLVNELLCCAAWYLLGILYSVPVMWPAVLLLLIQLSWKLFGFRTHLDVPVHVPMRPWPTDKGHHHTQVPGWAGLLQMGLILSLGLATDDAFN